MAEQKIVPEKITRPIQLLAAWLAGLVLIDGAFLTTAAVLSTPPCPSCGHAKLLLNDCLVMISSFQTALHSVHPAVEIVCARCANIRLFDARQLGLV